jgi:MFS family permease
LNCPGYHIMSRLQFFQHPVLFVFVSGELRNSPSRGVIDTVAPSVSFGLFLSLMDTTIVATALYTIGADLKSFGLINWVALAYTLSYLGCAVIFARIADIYGRRNAYIAAFLIFFAFSLGCGFSTSLTQLIACRTLQGVGGSGLYSLTFVILPEISPPGMMQAIGAIAGAVVAMAGVLGPVLGGVITHYTSWKWIFWIKCTFFPQASQPLADLCSAPIGIGPLILFIIAWPKPNQLCPARRRPLKELDTIGAILIIAASVLIVFSFQEAGLKTNAWKQAIFIVPLAIGCLCAAALVGWEYFVAHSWEGKVATMFPLRLMESRVYMGCVATALLGGFPYFVVIYALPLRLQVIDEKSALLAGVSLLPMLGSVAIASALGGGIHRKRERIFGALLAGSLFMVIGSACLSTLKNTVAVPAKMYGFEVFIGLGFGLMVSTVSLGAMIEADTLDRSQLPHPKHISPANRRSCRSRRRSPSPRLRRQYRHGSIDRNSRNRAAIPVIWHRYTRAIISSSDFCEDGDACSATRCEAGILGFL